MPGNCWKNRLRLLLASLHGEDLDEFWDAVPLAPPVEPLDERTDPDGRGDPAHHTTVHGLQVTESTMTGPLGPSVTVAVLVPVL